MSLMNIDIDLLFMVINTIVLFDLFGRVSIFSEMWC